MWFILKSSREYGKSMTHQGHGCFIFPGSARPPAEPLRSPQITLRSAGASPRAASHCSDEELDLLSATPCHCCCRSRRRRGPQATLAELVPVLGLARPESVPNLTKRFSTWLGGPTDARENLKKLRRQLGLRNN